MLSKPEKEPEQTPPEATGPVIAPIAVAVTAVAAAAESGVLELPLESTGSLITSSYAMDGSPEAGGGNNDGTNQGGAEAPGDGTSAVPGAPGSVAAGLMTAGSTAPGAAAGGRAVSKFQGKCWGTYEALGCDHEAELFEYSLDGRETTETDENQVTGGASDQAGAGEADSEMIKGDGQSYKGIFGTVVGRVAEAVEHCFDPYDEQVPIEKSLEMNKSNLVDENGESFLGFDQPDLEEKQYGDGKRHFGVFGVMNFRQVEMLEINRMMAATGVRGIIDPNDPLNPYGSKNAKAESVVIGKGASLKAVS